MVKLGHDENIITTHSGIYMCDTDNSYENMRDHCLDMDE